MMRRGKRRTISTIFAKTEKRAGVVRHALNKMLVFCACLPPFSRQSADFLASFCLFSVIPGTCHFLPILQKNIFFFNKLLTRKELIN
ncbi:MAG: hypothetical protein Q4C79_02205 [Neisseria sp.]|uniref:hypothetical protein n=1 Tax=Neisseria sp. TaxID=192066 RepID=UPI0026DB9810|nr:hypothetical protein [Neisseria sp.]MDO4247771.1 hypothetical protein [Neisseria sp.]